MGGPTFVRKFGSSIHYPLSIIQEMVQLPLTALLEQALERLERGCPVAGVVEQEPVCVCDLCEDCRRTSLERDAARECGNKVTFKSLSCIEHSI